MPDVSMPNYGLLNGLADGIKQGLITFQNMKNVQHQNQMQELMTGVQKNPDSGNLELTPERQAMMHNQGLVAQRQADELNPDSEISKKLGSARTSLVRAGNPKVSPNVYSGLSAADQKELDVFGKANIAGEYGLLGKSVMSPIADVKERTLGVSEHKTAIGGISDDKQIKGLQDGYQSMQNALVEFKNNPSPQSFHTLQAVARQNVGSNNKSGVTERASQYATDLGIGKDTVMQMITGNMQDVNASSPEMVNAILKVYEGELGMKQRQAAQQISKKKKAYETFYNNREASKYKPAFDDAVSEQYSQFGLNPDGTLIVDANKGLLESARGGDDQSAKLKRLQELRAKAAGG